MSSLYFSSGSTTSDYGFNRKFRVWWGKKNIPEKFVGNCLTSSDVLFTLSIVAVSQPEPVFVNLLRSPGIDSQPGGPVRQPSLSYRPARLHRLGHRGVFLCLCISGTPCDGVTLPIPTPSQGPNFKCLRTPGIDSQNWFFVRINSVMESIIG